MKLQEIELDKILIDENAIRKDLDDDTLKELRASIEARGLLSPLVVKPEGDKYRLIAGLRRYLVVSNLGWEKVPCIIWEKDDYNAALAQYEENIVREDVTPLEEGRYFKYLMDRYGLTVKAIAEDIYRSVDYVKERLRLTETDEYLQRAIQERLLNFSQAHLLSEVGDISLRRGLLEQTIREGLTTEQLRSLIKTYTHPQEQQMVYTSTNREDNIPPIPKHSYYVCPICGQEREQIDSIFLQICPTCYANLMNEIRKGNNSNE
jgi:ParB family chromosome partitioning protein